MPGTVLKVLCVSICFILFRTPSVGQNLPAQYNNSNEKPTFSFNGAKCQQVQMNPVIIKSIREGGVAEKSQVRTTMEFR